MAMGPRGMKAKPDIACPVCEYEKGSLGKPVSREGQMECLECGSTWRVFGTRNPVASETALKPDVIRELKEKLRHQQFDVASSENRISEPKGKSAGFASNVKSYAPGLGMLISCLAVLICFVAVFLGMQLLDSNSIRAQNKALYIGEIELDEQVRRNSSKVFTVRGLVGNPSDVSKPIPVIEIILRKTNGEEITRWYYNSSLASLKPGAKSRFASSIQYDTPAVAYAEAVFKR